MSITKKITNSLNEYRLNIAQLYKQQSVFEIENKEIIIKRIPEGATSFTQPLDVYFFHQWKDFVKRFSERILLYQIDVNLHDRNTIISLHVLILNQFQASIFSPMIQFAWHRSGFNVPYNAFDSIEKILFDVSGDVCSECDSSGFLQCSWCRKIFCLLHFLRRHYHSSP